MRRLVIDTDMASDDAVALMMALRHLGVHLDGGGGDVLRQSPAGLYGWAVACSLDMCSSSM